MHGSSLDGHDAEEDNGVAVGTSGNGSGIGGQGSQEPSPTVAELLLQAHAALMDAKLGPTVTRHFPKAWSVTFSVHIGSKRMG